jgi:hypothetical protein
VRLVVARLFRTSATDDGCFVVVSVSQRTLGVDDYRRAAYQRETTHEKEQ